MATATEWISLMKLDHTTIVTAELDVMRRFLCDVVGLTEGQRPPFGIAGHWLYAGGQPVIHLIADPAPGRLALASPRIDHVAFRIEHATEWNALIARMRAHDVPYQLAEVPLTQELQLFVALAPGVAIEFVTALTGT
jgi:catechol 2,3-dioxygenase-like lactoylglutathione lyase family enzyme